MSRRNPPAVDSRSLPGIQIALFRTIFRGREDAAAFVETCRYRNLPAASEWSRSGRGAHGWIFFEEAARDRFRFLRLLLSEPGHVSSGRLRQLDRPAVDDTFEPHHDPLAFLAIEALVSEAERRGQIVGVGLPSVDEDEPERWTARRKRSRPRSSPTTTGPVDRPIVVILEHFARGYWAHRRRVPQARRRGACGARSTSGS